MVSQTVFSVSPDFLTFDPVVVVPATEQIFSNPLRLPSSPVIGERGPIPQPPFIPNPISKALMKNPD
jgi:hypothetical protein